MMTENRTCLVASRRNKKDSGQDYFEWSSFSTNPIGIHSKIAVSLLKKKAIQYIHPILNVNTLKCFNIKTLKYQNVEILKL